MSADLVARIEAAAKEKGLNLSTIERTLGLGNSTIRRWQTQSPRLDKLLLVARCLDVSLDYLVSGTAVPMSVERPAAGAAQEVGARLRLLLRERHLTQSDLCRLSGLSTTAVSQYCTGKRTPDTAALIALSHALDVSVDWLLGLALDTPAPALSGVEWELLDTLRSLPPEARLDVCDYARFKLCRTAAPQNSPPGPES